VGSWKATDRVKPVWQAWGKKHGVDKAVRDEFAKAVGTSGTVLSSLNTGSTPMTMAMAGRIAKEGGVSVLELGAPVAGVDERGQTLLDRLDELTGKLADSETMQVRQERQIRDLRRRVAALEARHERDEDESKDPPTAGRPQ